MLNLPGALPGAFYSGINKLYSGCFKAEEPCERKSLELIPLTDQVKNNLIEMKEEASNANSLEGPTCPFNPFLLEEVILVIGENAKTDLPSLQLVNKKWKDVTGVVYAKMFLEIQHLVSGKRKYEEYMDTYGQDLGPEVVPHLPYKVYDDLKNNLCMVTWYPLAVPVKNEKIGLVLMVAPAAGVMGELVQNPKKGNKTCFASDSWFDGINEPRDIRGGKWVVTYKANMHKGIKYAEQAPKAKELGKGADVVDFDETVFAVFMHYVEKGEKCFSRNPANHDYSLVRTKTVSKDGWRFVLGFGPSGLYVSNPYDCAYDSIGVAFSRSPLTLEHLGL